MRQQISSAISVVVQVARLTDGKRKVLSIQEITGMEGDVITMQEIFSSSRPGWTSMASVIGHFCATGVRPRFIERLRTFGVTISESLFDPTRQYH